MGRCQATLRTPGSESMMVAGFVRFVGQVGGNRNTDEIQQNRCQTLAVVTVPSSQWQSTVEECLSKDNLASSEEPPFRRRWLKRREEEKEEATETLSHSVRSTMFHWYSLSQCISLGPLNAFLHS